MTDTAVAWRDEQIEMLRDEISRLNRNLSEVIEERNSAIDRAEAAENRLRILTEEVAECRPTT